MVLVEFDRKNWFWSILAGKTDFLQNKLVCVNFGRKVGLVDFDWKNWFLTKKRGLVDFDRKNWVLAKRKRGLVDFGQKNGFWLILAEKIGFRPKKVALVNFGQKKWF